MRTAILVIAIGLLVFIAYGDVRTRRIPNALCLGIAVLGGFRIAISDHSGAIGQTLAAAAMVFTGSFLLFWRGAIGGGDAKLVTSMALIIGHDEVFGFLVLMSLCGAVLALATLARDSFWPCLVSLGLRVRGRSSSKIAENAEPPPKSTIPYGVAVAVAGVITLMFSR